MKPAPHLKPFGGQVDSPAPHFIAVNAKVAEVLPQIIFRRFYKCLHKYAKVSDIWAGIGS